MKRIIFLILSIFFYSTCVYAGSTQTNTTGSNTAIEGGYTSSTTYESGSTSTSTTTSTSNTDIKSSPPSAYAPSVNSSGLDVCSTGGSAGLQTFGFGISGGKSFRDENCERIKLSRQLDSMGMKVAAVALLCQDPRVFEAMIHAGTPCPYNGKIGKDALILWKKYDKLRPDYKEYTKDLKVIEKINEDEQKEMTKEFSKIDNDIKIENLKKVK